MQETAFRSKRVCLSLADWQAFSEALNSAYPAARYVPTLAATEYYRDEPPDVSIAKSLSAFLHGDERPYEVTMMIDPAARIHWVKGNSRWYTGHRPYPIVKFLPGGQVIDDKPDQPPHIRSGDITVFCDAGNKEHFAFSRRFYKLFGQFATNTNQIGYTYPDYHVLWTIEKGSDTWLGHDALRWAREDKKRLLYYDHRGWGYRPNDEGIFKSEEKSERSKLRSPSRHSSSP